MDWKSHLGALSRAATAMVVAAVLLVTVGRAQSNSPPLTITDQSLPTLNLGIDVRIPLHAIGGVPPYRWMLTGGELPEGINLDPSGFLFGRASRPGTFVFSLTVTDSASPAHVLSKDFKSQVKAALLLEWRNPPTVQNDEISGSVQVSNDTESDDFDLTVIVVAVNENGRATALGYQHFTIKPGVTNFAIPFGSTLPVGSYVVYADAIAEIPPKNTILRRHLESSMLSIVPTP
jgi:hypothetical protein